MSARSLTDSASKAWRAASVDLRTPDVMQAARTMAVRQPDMDRLIEDLLKEPGNSPAR